MTEAIFSMNSHHSYVYILTNLTNRVLYVGITSDLVKRVSQHKHKMIRGFTSKYNTNKLVYYEVFEDIDEAFLERSKLRLAPGKRN